jgi:predicted ATPase/class 3 adenylate cyclase/DNA-binding CsgD family transcriptional regulator
MYRPPKGTVTFLFTDIEGSTHLQQQLGDRYSEVLAELRQLLRAAFRVWNGHEVDTQGDAFFVAFARATDAVSAAVDMQRALAAHVWPNGVIVRVRLGMHTGEPSLGSEGYIGLDVVRSARIMSAGHGGQVLLSQTTRDIVEHNLPDGVSLHDLGVHRLKDLQHPSHLFQLVIAGLLAEFPPLRTLDTHPHNLPIQPTPFLGREHVLVRVQGLLRREDVRLFTLTGPGGIGKTRLGLQVAADLADRFADGVFFVNLAPLSDSSLVLPTIASTLDLKESAGQAQLHVLTAYLRNKELLLLLDNFEQVLSAAVQVAALLAACPKLKVLVTSRTVLHVHGEQEFAVPPLAVPDPKRLHDLVELSQYEAVMLFIQQAQTVKPDFQLTNVSASAVVEICTRLDGLPLAIELAAARMKLLPPQALLGRLSQRLTVLTGGARDVPARQQTLRNTITWSYNLLDALEQQLFQRLSVFVGGCTLEAIEAIYTVLDGNQSAGHILDRVASLIDKSLLHQTEQEGEEPRFAMLETIREYGLEVLAASGEMTVMRQAQAAYYLEVSEEAEPELVGPRQARWLERLEREHDNLRAAMSCLLEQGKKGDGMEMALRLGGALLRFWVERGHMSEGQTFLERTLATREGVAASVQAKALLAAGGLALNQSDYEQAEAQGRESLDLYRELGDAQGIADSCGLLGEVASSRGNLATARSLFEEVLALYRETADKEGIAWSLGNLASLDRHQGKYAAARTLCEESLAIYTELGDKARIARSCYLLASVLYISPGDAGTVRSLLEKGLALFREVGSKEGIAFYFYISGEVVLRQGDAVLARSLAEESLERYRELGHRLGMTLSLALLAQTAASQGDYAAARTLYEESLTLTSKTGDKRNIAPYLEGLAHVVVAQGKLTWAARLWGAAEALRETMGTPIWPVERANYEHSVTTARNQLGEKSFATAWAQGRTLTLEQALAAPEEPSSVPSAPKASTYPDGLTAREVEVLRVVAQGLTNEQVAERLVISSRTVNTHLTSIYGKIGVTSRATATRYAMEHHLV